MWSPLKTPKCTWVTKCFKMLQICKAENNREMLQVNREHTPLLTSMAQEHTHRLQLDLDWRVDRSNFWRPWVRRKNTDFNNMLQSKHFSPISIFGQILQLKMLIYIFILIFILYLPQTAEYYQPPQPEDRTNQTHLVQEQHLPKKFTNHFYVGSSRLKSTTEIHWTHQIPQRSTKELHHHWHDNSHQHDENKAHWPHPHCIVTEKYVYRNHVYLRIYNMI